ncbi:MAG: putative transporter [Phycisphaerae bacterium]|nr:putative transporter [Phycisphaerae bacterium]
MDAFVLTVFILVYVGMFLGRLPGLAVDRTGVALLGAIALLVGGRLDGTQARNAVDVTTLGLLFGLMVVSAQFRLGGAYSALTRRIAAANVGPEGFLALVIAASGALSAVLANDVVCLAMTPLLIEGCVQRGLKPMPFLLALACASNVGSAATIIGNPQNMLIGQTLGLSFGAYLIDGGVPAALGLAATWWIIRRRYRGRWTAPVPVMHVEAPAFNPWQTAKATLVAAALVGVFLVAPWPREIVALAAAGILLLSRRMHSRDMLGLVDWQLLVLFIGLFIVNHALEASGTLGAMLNATRDAGVDPDRPASLFILTVILSNLVSNVPAVMLLLSASDHALAGPILALSSTLAGNLLLVGSIANLIVADQAARFGVRLTWSEHARTGVPVTLATLAIAAGWLGLRAAMG